MMLTAAPLASHFSCWRRSPVARRQLSTWRAMKAIDSQDHEMSGPSTALNQPAAGHRRQAAVAVHAERVRGQAPAVAAPVTASIAANHTP